MINAKSSDVNVTKLLTEGFWEMVIDTPRFPTHLTFDGKTLQRINVWEAGADYSGPGAVLTVYKEK